MWPAGVKTSFDDIEIVSVPADSNLKTKAKNVYSFYLGVAGNFRELIEYLNGSTEILAKNGNILDNVLETLDSQQHSLGVLYVLVAKFSNITVSFWLFLCTMTMTPNILCFRYT